MEEDMGVPGDFGMVCHRKKQRRKRQKLLIIDLFFDFAKNTTLHGLRYITEVGLTAIEKIFWIITFVISVILCFVLIERVWYKWWNSPVIVSFNERMIPVGEVPFPSLTICPQWKIKNSKFNYSLSFKKFVNLKRRSNKSTLTLKEQEKLENVMMVCAMNGYLTNRNISDESVVKDIIEVAPQENEIFPKRCNWRGKRHSCSLLFKKVLTSEGVCFNFNALANKDIFRKDSIQTNYTYINSVDNITGWDFDYGYNSTYRTVFPRRGQENGAKPDLNFVLAENPGDNDDLCNSMSNGFKIYLHHPADMPQSSLYFYAAIPGQLTSLAVKFSVLNTSETLMKYSSDLRQCYFPKDRYLRYFNTYTPDNCRLECISNYTYKRCRCVWFHMPHSNSSEICTASSKQCVGKAQDSLASFTSAEMKEECNCLPSCNSIQYDAEILKTNYDFKKNQKAFERLYGYEEFLADTRNFSKVEVYFKEPRFVSMRRSELFGLTDFLASCGGLLGLFLGFSFLSLVEMFYFCTLRLWCTLKRDIKIEKKQLRESMHKKY